MLPKSYEENSRIKISIVVARYYLSHKKLEKLSRKFLKYFESKDYLNIVNIKFVDLKSESKDLNTKLTFDWKDKEPKFFDFSAYEEMQTNDNSDLFLYINDTLFIKHPWRVIGKRLKSLLPTASSIDNPAAVGIVYPYSEALLIDKTNPSLEHMTTFCFALNRSSNKVFIETLKSLQDSNTKKDEWIKDKINSNLFIKYLMNIHIYGPKSPWRWAKIDDNFLEEKLSSKAISVILEYDLNANILNSNGLIIPISRDLKYFLFQKLQSLIGRVIYREYF